MDRREDWPERLTALIDLRRATPFAWGVQDCVTFAAAAIEAMTGADPLADLTRWNSREQAIQAISSLGSDLSHAVMARLGEPIMPTLARRGDLLLVETDVPGWPGGQALGVCIGAHAVAPGPVGLEWVNMDRWRAAWRIG